MCIVLNMKTPSNMSRVKGGGKLLGGLLWAPFGGPESSIDFPETNEG